MEHDRAKSSDATPHTSERSSSEPLAEVQRALLVVLVLHAPHPEAGGLLGLRKLRKHSEKSERGGKTRKSPVAK
jgi:hypothetical protein